MYFFRLKTGKTVINSNQSLWNQVVEQTKNEYLPTFFIRKEGSDSGPIFCPDKDFKNDN